MAEIVEEKIESEYSGSIVGRLAKYLKPYKKEVIISLVLVLFITCFELLRPVLIGDAIDTYIEAYNEPYAISDTVTDIVFNGDYLSRDLDGANQFAQILNDGENYYYFSDLNKIQSDELYNISKEEIIPEYVDNTKMIIKGYEGILLDSEDLKVIRSHDISGMTKIGIIYILVLLLNTLCTYNQTMILQKTGQKIIYTIRNEIFHHIHSLPLRYFDTHPVGRIVTRVTNDVEALHEMYANILIRLFKNAVKII